MHVRGLIKSLRVKYFRIVESARIFMNLAQTQEGIGNFYTSLKNVQNKVTKYFVRSGKSSNKSDFLINQEKVMETCKRDSQDMSKAIEHFALSDLKCPCSYYIKSFFFQWAKRYGGIYSIKMGSVNCVVLSQFELIKEFFSKAEFSGRAPLFLTHGIMEGKNKLIHEADPKHCRYRSLFSHRLYVCPSVQKLQK